MENWVTCLQIFCQTNHRRKSLRLLHAEMKNDFVKLVKRKYFVKLIDAQPKFRENNRISEELHSHSVEIKEILSRNFGKNFVKVTVVLTQCGKVP